MTIQEAHPLKQGLKLGNLPIRKDPTPDSRGTSTKTRIETSRSHLSNILGLIQEAHPLKQGLKHLEGMLYISMMYLIQEAHPLKQGLKPS